jgi:hypothetical protein
MRTTNPTPRDLAASQAIAAVRRLPRWRSPVGEGAKRPTTSTVSPTTAPMHTRVPELEWTLCGPVRGRHARRRMISYSRGMRCPRCETEVADHQKFCHDCGAALSLPAPDAPVATADTDDR